MNHPTDLDIAIAHKDYDTRGGGEVFVRRLAEWLDCPVYVGRRNQANEPDDADLDIRAVGTPEHRSRRVPALARVHDGVESRLQRARRL